MRNTINFSAGPATLPEPVLAQASAEMLDWHGSGQSVMEMSHRGKHYMQIHAQAEADFRDLLAVPSNYKVLFLQGGATQQFAMVPVNLLAGRKRADYVNTGEWSKKAIKEASLFCEAHVVASSQDRNFTYVPEQADWKRSSDAAYLHYCANETIGGVEFNWIPQVSADVPLVADVSSNFLSRPLDVPRFGLIYGGAQKNIGPAGLVIVVVREDLLGHARPTPPTMLDYKQQADAGSMLNTPPTWAIYIAGLVFQWLKREGGLAAIEQKNIAKSKLLYETIDASSLYRNLVAHADRSRMNVPFTLADARLDAPFLEGAAERGMIELKGHRSVGGMRASIYNAMSIEGVKRLTEYMREFERSHG